MSLPGQGASLGGFRSFPLLTAFWNAGHFVLLPWDPNSTSDHQFSSAVPSEMHGGFSVPANTWGRRIGISYLIVGAPAVAGNG